MSAMTLEYLAKTDRWTLKIAFSTLLSESDEGTIHVAEVVDANLYHEVSILEVKTVVLPRNSSGIVVNSDVSRRHVYFPAGANESSFNFFNAHTLVNL
jgi:hypothetical protein